MSVDQTYAPLNVRAIKNKSFVRNWLYIILFLCLVIVMVGGATRMTGSGLSITEWKPIHGTIPPIGQAEWNEEFLKYQKIAQYKQINDGMSLENFKRIFWWEWIHRFLARIVGLIALLPFFYFSLKLVVCSIRRPLNISSHLKKWAQQPLLSYYILVPLLIGLQGAIGWWMVYSGLGQSALTSVSQYRLAIHLITACIIMMIVTYLARCLVQYKENPAPRRSQKDAGWIVLFVFIQIYLGALVAGLHAGFSFNTWPLMDEQIIPDGLLSMSPMWRNFFENTLTVQFIHRIFSYFLICVVIYHVFQTKKHAANTAHSRRAKLLLFAVGLQAIFGIVTLLTRVPIQWGLIHQLFALLVLIFAVCHWRATKANG